MAIIFRPTSADAAKTKPQADKLARPLVGARGVRASFIDGFLMRAVSNARNVIVTVIDAPILYFSNRIDTYSAGLRAFLSPDVGATPAPDVVDTLFVASETVKIGNAGKAFPYPSGYGATSCQTSSVTRSKVAGSGSKTGTGTTATFMAVRHNVSLACATTPPKGSLSKLRYVLINAESFGIPVNYAQYSLGAIEWGPGRGAMLYQQGNELAYVIKYSITEPETPGDSLIGSVTDVIGIPPVNPSTEKQGLYYWPDWHMVYGTSGNLCSADAGVVGGNETIVFLRLRGIDEVTYEYYDNLQHNADRALTPEGDSVWLWHDNFSGAYNPYPAADTLDHPFDPAGYVPRLLTRQYNEVISELVTIAPDGVVTTIPLAAMLVGRWLPEHIVPPMRSDGAGVELLQIGHVLSPLIPPDPLNDPPPEKEILLIASRCLLAAQIVPDPAFTEEVIGSYYYYSVADDLTVGPVDAIRDYRYAYPYLVAAQEIANGSGNPSWQIARDKYDDINGYGWYWFGALTAAYSDGPAAIIKTDGTVTVIHMPGYAPVAHARYNSAAPSDITACEYSDGFLAILVTPLMNDADTVFSTALSWRGAHIAVVDKLTGAVLQITPQLALYQSRISISNAQMGVVVDGVVTKFARLLVSISDKPPINQTVERTDIYAVQDLSTAIKVASSSGVGTGYYLGNALVPADIGRDTRMPEWRYTKPPPP
jgi:hypothetical protein